MDYLNLVKKLISIDSSNKENANKAIIFCKEYLSDNGIEGEIITNNGYMSYITSIGKGEKTLVLNGHLDVVSGKPCQFTPIDKDGKIFGRGSADMKSGCVAMMNAIIKLKDENLKSNVMLQLVSDEEIGGENCTGYLVDKGYLGDFVICTEPTNLEVSIQSKGIIRMDIESFGVSAHGSRPWEGKNAILKGIENYNKIKNLPIMNESSNYYKNSTANLAFIKGGDIYNKVPDKSLLGLDIRYVPHIDPKDIIKDIEEVVDGNVFVNAIEPGVNCECSNEYIKKLSSSVKKILPYKKIKYVAQHGGSDGRFFATKGIPIVEFGPKGNYWHGDDEYVEKESIKQLEEILIDFARKF